MSGRRDGATYLPHFGNTDANSGTWDPAAKRQVESFESPATDGTTAEEDKTFKKLVAHVEGADRNGGGSVRTGGMMDADVYRDFEEQEEKLNKTVVLRARSESNQLALARAAQERERELAVMARNNAYLGLEKAVGR